MMKKIVLLVVCAATLSACSPARTVGNVAIGAGQVALGTADLLI